MSLVLKDLVLKVSLDLLGDVTDLQIDVKHEQNKHLSKILDTLSLSLADVIEVLNEES